MKRTEVAEVFGAAVYDSARHHDHRGFFQEVYSSQRYDGFQAVQSNISRSERNVVRGMHIAPFGKLCTCVNGLLFDVVVDVRKDSPTYKGWFGIWLGDHESKQLYVPPGCAHGFFSAKTGTMLLYYQDGLYDPKVESLLHWRDPEIGIEWPWADDYILSEKDAAAPCLSHRSAT